MGSAPPRIPAQVWLSDMYPKFQELVSLDTAPYDSPVGEGDQLHAHDNPLSYMLRPTKSHEILWEGFNPLSSHKFQLRFSCKILELFTGVIPGHRLWLGEKGANSRRPAPTRPPLCRYSK